MANTVIGVYDNFAQAQSALRQLLATGFSSSAVRLRPSEDTQQARAAALKAAGATDAGTASQSTGGTLRGFFHDLFSGGESTQGQSQTHADRYAEAVRRGSFVLTADASSAEEADTAAATMEQFQPIDVDERATEWQASGWSGHDENAAPLTDAELTQERAKTATAQQADLAGRTTSGVSGKTLAGGESQAIPVLQEELAISKREVQRGGVRVVQRVIETPVRETLSLREERVVVERHAVNQPATAAELASMKEGTIELREMGEEAVVSKTARVVEEVIVGKQVSEKEAVVSDTVRRTDVSVEQMGAGASSIGSAGTAGMAGTAGTAGAGTAGDDDFRNHWQTAYGTSGQRYEDYAPAYQYGATLGTDERYRGMDWSSSEPTIRAQWESAHPQNAWEKVKDAVQYGWNKVAH